MHRLHFKRSSQKPRDHFYCKSERKAPDFLKVAAGELHVDGTETDIFYQRDQSSSLTDEAVSRDQQTGTLLTL